MRLNENYVEKEDYLNILKLFSNFNKEKKDGFIFIYSTEGEELTRLKESFDYSKCAVKANQFRTMVNLMKWVSENLIGDGMCIPPKIINAEYILKMTKEKKINSNCFMSAVVLNEIYLSMGFKSRMVRCMPIDLDFKDCHCVTEVYSDVYKKWIVFDAANKAYYIDKDMKPLNLFELRENLLECNPVYVPMMKRDLAAGLFQYLSRNLVRFESYQISRYDAENRKGTRVLFHFQSEEFPIRDKVVDFPEDGVVIQHVHTSNPDLFWAKPT